MVTLLLNYLGGTNFEDRGDKTHISEEESQTWEAILRNSILIGENAVRVLQANNVYVNGPNIVVDEMTDSTGTKNTVNTGTTTAKYNTTDSEYIISYTDEASGDTTSEYTETDSWTNVSNAFDNNDTTYAQMLRTSATSDTTVDSGLGKTFTSKLVSLVKIKASFTFASGSENKAIILQTYNGTIWSDVSTLASTNATSGTISYDDTYQLEDTVQGVRAYFQFAETANAKTWDRRLHTLEYGDYNSSDTVIIDSNTTTLDGNELGFAVSIPDSDIPTNTSITATISDGTNSLTATAIDTVSKGIVIGNPGTLTSGTLKVEFTLSTTDTSVTPTLSNYAINILR